MCRARLAAVLVATAAATSAGAATTAASGPPLLTFVAGPVPAGPGRSFEAGLCASDLHGHTFRITDPQNDLTPSWSPASRLIAFVRVYRYPRGDDVLVADPQGRGLRRLTVGASHGTYYEPRWAPDGRSVGFGWSGLGSALEIVHLDGSPGTSLYVSYPGFVSTPSWSPDGKTILFSIESDASGTYADGTYVMGSDGSNRHLLLGSAFLPVWAPDDNRFAYFAVVSGTTRLGVANADGSNPRLLVEANAASWSPDGEQLAYTTAEGDLGVAQADGSGSRVLVHGVASYDVSWSPDSQEIAFVHGSHLSVVRPDGTGERIVQTDGLSARSPVWRPAAPLPKDRRPCAVRGTVGNDVLRGTARGDLIFGEAGDDRIYGGGGNDALVGGHGHDRLYGGRGDDVLSAWDRTRDVLSGGPGTDTAFADFADRATSVEHLHRRR